MANEDKATRYHRSRRRAGAASLAIGVGSLGLAVLGGGSAAVRDVVGGTGSAPGIAASFGYGALMAALVEVIRIPGAYYAGVTLERRYGLSVNPVARWWRDQMSRSAATATLAAIGAALVSAALRWVPDVAWMVLALALAAALYAAARLAPWFMRPAAGDILPRVRQDLSNRLHALADRCGTPVAEIAVVYVSPRTRKASATLVGLGPSRRILLSDTLLAEHGDEEVEVIVAHELAHAVYHDADASLALQCAVIASACYVADRVLAASVGPLGLAGKADLAGLPIVVMAAGAVSAAWLPLSNLLSQFQERRADRFAVAATGNGEALVRALRHIGAVNLADPRPGRITDRFLHTHPSLTSRIDAALGLLRAGRRSSEGSGVDANREGASP